MALVGGETELSMFPMPNHLGSMHHLMDWSGEHGVHTLPRGMNHSDDLANSFMGSLDNFAHPSFGISESQFDLSDGYLTPKMDPGCGTLSTPGAYGYFNPASQVSSSQSSYHLSGGNSYTPQQHAYTSQSSIQQQGGGGILEDIDGVSRNFPEQQHHDLDVVGPLYYDDISPFSSSMSSVSGLGGTVSQQQNEMQWVDFTMLPRELRESLTVSDNSSVDNQSLNSENSPMIFPSAEDPTVGNFFPDVSREYSTVSSNWGGASGSLKSSTPASQPQVALKHQHAPSRLGGLGHGGGYPPPEPNYYLRPPVGFGSNVLAPLSHLQSQNPRMLSNIHSSQLSDEVLLGTLVPATGLQLVHLLLACAEAVAENRLKDAEVILARLRNHVLPNGNPMQRLAAYFEEALRERLTKGPSSAGRGTQDCNLPQAEVLEAFSVYYDCIPIGKFGHLTCNQILLDAVEREKVVHVLDLHIWHGMQWPAFLQALALRHGGPPKLRMSAVGADAADLAETGEKLHECAKNLSVPFEFCPILTTLDQFNADMVELRRGECLVVNSFVQFHGILNSANSLNVLLGDLRRLDPRVMAFAENDGNHNCSSFLIRFVECLRYYSAVFDAFDASLPHDSASRMRMEKIFAAQKIMNIIACEGPARVDGHETMKYWHKKMEAAHFRCLPLSSRAVSQANLLLNLYYSNGYTLNTSDCGYLALGWHGMPLMGVSAWH